MTKVQVQSTFFYSKTLYTESKNIIRKTKRNKDKYLSCRVNPFTTWIQSSVDFSDLKWFMRISNYNLKTYYLNNEKLIEFSHFRFVSQIGGKLEN